MATLMEVRLGGKGGNGRPIKQFMHQVVQETVAGSCQELEELTMRRDLLGYKKLFQSTTILRTEGQSRRI